MEPPFIVMGPPRSGSTLFARTLNQHPNIICTDEARPFLAAARALEPLHSRDDHEPLIRQRVSAAMRSAITSYYRSIGARPGTRWGDKFPHYAEPWILGAIEELFPGTRYIHLTRNRDAVIRSALASRIVSNEATACQVYDDISTTCDDWKSHVGDRMVTIHYEQSLISNIAIACNLLGCPITSELHGAVRREALNPTRYSHPTSW